MFQDKAASGEAAAIGIGLILLGLGLNNEELISELLAYAHDTQHEKIIRGIAIAIALMYYGQVTICYISFHIPFCFFVFLKSYRQKKLLNFFL